MKVRIAFFLLLAAGFLGLAYFYLYPFAELNAEVMGSPIRIQVNGIGAPVLAGQALNEIRRLDNLFSTFKPESEISRLNRSGSEEPVELSKETSEIFAMASRIKHLSRGAFDITLGSREESKAPVDLGGIGKGFAVEKARQLLLKGEAKSGIIDLRSSIAVFGPREWRIAIRHPRVIGKFLGTIVLRDGQSLSTSGDYEQENHIIDPRTGQPAELCQAVTIIGTDAGVADALSTAVFVLGPKEGMKLIEESSGIAGLIVDAQGKIIMSTGFKLE